MLSEYASTLLCRLTDSMFAMEANLHTLGARLKSAREEVSASRPQLAALVGVTRAAIKQWEDDKVKNLRPEHLLRVCDKLGIEPNWLVFGKGPRYQTRSAVQREREGRWLAIAGAMTTEQADQFLAYLESRIKLEAAGLLPANLSNEESFIIDVEAEELTRPR